MYQTEYVVSGKTLFPLDMLRSTNSVPNRHADAVFITSAIVFPNQETRQIVLRTLTSKLPSAQSLKISLEYARWISFGWEIIHVEASTVV